MRKIKKNPIKLQQGDIKIQSTNMSECQELAVLAKTLRKSTAPKVKLGKLSITAGTPLMLLVIGGGSILMYGIYKYIDKRWLRGNNYKNNEPQDNNNIHELLKGRDEAPEVTTLNEIGKQDAGDLIPMLGDYYYSGDIVYLFSITNKGKTLIGLQNAIELAQGIKSRIVPSETVPPKQDVFYYNFEMRKNQLKKRYFDNNPSANYPENLKLINCGSTIHNVEELLEDMANRLESIVNDTVVFIDTIKDVCPTFFSNEATRVIRSLRNIINNIYKTKGKRLTIVLIGQTVKKKPWEPIELDDLSGSFHQSGLADSVFALGETRFGKDTRMLKMLKGRCDELHDKVDLVRIVTDTGLHVEYIKSIEEGKALPIKPKAEKGSERTVTIDDMPKVPKEVVEQMRSMHKKGVPGCGLKAVLKKYGSPYGLKYPTQIQRLLDQYESEES